MLLKILESDSKNVAPEISSTEQDRLWIAETLAGNPETYAHLVNKYKGPLFDLTCRVLKNRSEGEDILQEAFLKIYRHLGSFRNDSKFSTWIYAIVMNSLRNHLRKNKALRCTSLDAGLPGYEDTYAPEICDNEPPVDLLLERKMDIEAIRQIIATFSLTYQSIFTMYYFQDLSLQEIADRLGRPEGTVKVYLHRSRKMLYASYAKRAVTSTRTVSSFRRSGFADMKYSSLS